MKKKIIVPKLETIIEQLKEIEWILDKDFDVSNERNINWAIGYLEEVIEDINKED